MGFFGNIKNFSFLCASMLLIAVTAFADEDAEIERVIREIKAKNPKVEIYVHGRPIAEELSLPYGDDVYGKEYERLLKYEDIVHKEDLLKTLKAFYAAMEQSDWNRGSDEKSLLVHITNDYLSEGDAYSHEIKLSVADTIGGILSVYSGSPEKEPKVQEYLEKNYEDFKEFLINELDPQIDLRGLVCNKPWYEDWSNQFIQDFYRNSSIQMQTVPKSRIKVWKKGKTNRLSAFTKTFYGSGIEFESPYAKNETVKIISDYQITDVEVISKNGLGQTTKVSRVRYNSKDCSVISGKAEFMNSLGQVTRVRRLKRDGIVKDIYSDREVFSLLDVYSQCTHLPEGKSMEDILELAHQLDRIGVAIVDSGIDYNHPELAYKISRSTSEKGEGRLEKGWDFDKENSRPYDYSVEPTLSGDRKRVAHHGTHVAGIAAQGNDRVEIIPIRVSFSEAHLGDGQERNTRLVKQRFDAVAHAVQKGARIINLSMLMPAETLERLALKYPQVLFVKGAGNGGKGAFHHDLFFNTRKIPDNLIVVAASTSEGELADFSDRDAHAVQLAAAGVDILSTLPEKKYGKLSGTSMATPQVTNVASKILAINPKLSPKELKDIILTTVKHVPSLKGKVETGGVLDEASALEKAKATLGH